MIDNKSIKCITASLQGLKEIITVKRKRKKDRWYNLVSKYKNR